jgi:hypothetical protein
MGDSLRDLPTDSLPPTVDEKEMIQWMFTGGEGGKDTSVTTTGAESQASMMTPRFHMELKTLLVIMLLYVAVSSSWTDSLIEKILPITTTSPIFLIATKSILFAIILLLFFHYTGEN